MSQPRAIWVDQTMPTDRAEIETAVKACLAILSMVPEAFDWVGLRERPMMGRKLAVRVVPSLVLNFDQRLVVIPGPAMKLSAARIEAAISSSP